jgi:hypothetical protein
MRYSFHLKDKENVVASIETPNQLCCLHLTDLKPDPDPPRKYIDPQTLEELIMVYVNKDCISMGA